MTRFLLLIVSVLAFYAVPAQAQKYSQSEVDEIIDSVTAQFTIAIARERRVLGAEASRGIQNLEKRIAELKKIEARTRAERDANATELHQARQELAALAAELAREQKIDQAFVDAFRTELTRREGDASGPRLAALQLFGDGDQAAALALLGDLRIVRREARAAANETREALQAAQDIRDDLPYLNSAKSLGSATALQVRKAYEELLQFDRLSFEEARNLARLRMATGDPLGGREAFEMADTMLEPGWPRFQLLAEMLNYEQAARNGAFATEYEVELAKRADATLLAMYPDKGAALPSRKGRDVTDLLKTKPYDPADWEVATTKIWPDPDPNNPADSKWEGLFFEHLRQVRRASDGGGSQQQVDFHIDGAANILETYLSKALARPRYLLLKYFVSDDVYRKQLGSAGYEKKIAFLDTWESDARELYGIDPTDVAIRGNLAMVLRERIVVGLESEKFDPATSAREEELLELSLSVFEGNPRSTPNYVFLRGDITRIIASRVARGQLDSTIEFVTAVIPKIDRIEQAYGGLKKDTDTDLTSLLRAMKAGLYGEAAQSYSRVGRLAETDKLVDECLALFPAGLGDVGLIDGLDTVLQDCRSLKAFTAYREGRNSEANAQFAVIANDAIRYWDQKVPDALAADPSYQKGERAYMHLLAATLGIAITTNNAHDWELAMKYISEAERAGYTNREQFEPFLKEAIARGEAILASQPDVTETDPAESETVTRNES